MIPLGYEVNFDGIAGPTHNYSGLSYGNLASMRHRDAISNPKLAALQGLRKMKLFLDLGQKQAVLPPHERPHLPTLRALGFSGPDPLIPQKVFQKLPHILYETSSAAAMWTAQAATITPSIDSIDERVHITPANKSMTRHREIEAPFTAQVLRAVFPSNVYFAHHPPLPLGTYFADEGAANHCHFCREYNQTGIYLFVYGQSSETHQGFLPKKYPARQTLEASQAIVRSHQLFPERVVFAQQNPLAIDMGVFHNDLVAVGNKHFFFYHENAYDRSRHPLLEIGQKLEEFSDTKLIKIEVPAAAISIQAAVRSYLFNSQIICTPEGSIDLVVPLECRQHEHVYTYLEQLIQDPENPLRKIHFLDLSESMGNGGGPACLSLRTVLTQNEINAAHPNVFLTEKRYQSLAAWVEKYYRDRLEPKDLADPKLVEETQAALHALTRILDLGNIYSFQK
ncbi:MAG: N-succinylarginine dihydrolase [Waddliaceae bacterium]